MPFGPHTVPPDPDQTTALAPELGRIVAEEEQCLERVLTRLAQRTRREPGKSAAEYEREMIELRDEMAAARLEDVPPMLEQMERLQALAKHKRDLVEGQVDVKSPYFGHLVLEEDGRRREVLIGRGTYLDTNSGVRIVDWRDAPVSRLYYRYEEGETYDEVFGEREVSGEVVTRRNVTIRDAVLRRVGAPQGSFLRTAQGTWRQLEAHAGHLTGGQGSASRPDHFHKPGRLGVGSSSDQDDKVLQEITPLIDPRQFELLTRPDSGIVVIQGGAGSGKTTIGLHRMAYLAFRDPRRFRPDKMLVVVFNEALARYINHVLPALGITGVGIRTYEEWAARVRQQHFPELPRAYQTDTPGVVTRLKKHPAMLGAIDALVAEMANGAAAEALGFFTAAGAAALATQFSEAWTASQARPLVLRLKASERWLETVQDPTLTSPLKLTLERCLRRHREQAENVPAAWAELGGHLPLLRETFGRLAPGAFTDRELAMAHAWCDRRAADALGDAEDRSLAKEEAREETKEEISTKDDVSAPYDDTVTNRGVDGELVDEGASLDREDDALLLKLHQKLRGPLARGVALKEPLVYEHLFIDEAQDLSPVELDVVLGTLSRRESATLAGDVAQRLLLDNGFTDWETVLRDLAIHRVDIEPLRLSYRSTQEILEFAEAVLGPLAPKEPSRATRRGAPVELFAYSHSGDSMAFLAETLRELNANEPRASVAVIARFPEQADLYYDGLKRGEVANLRRVAHQDFTFKAGVDVTDVRQVKGLEFDYVLLVEVSDAAYPDDIEARHLLHIAATRAAHQLWILTTGRPSPLLPKALIEANA